MSKFRPKQAAQHFCPTAQSRRSGIHGWQVFDSATGEVLGSGQCAESAWHLAYVELSQRVSAPTGIADQPAAEHG